MKYLVEETLRAGAVPIPLITDDRAVRNLIAFSDVPQMKAFGRTHLSLMKQMDAYIGIRGGQKTPSRPRGCLRTK